MRDVDEDNSLLSMTPSQDCIPPPDPLRVDWPKVVQLFLFYKQAIQSSKPLFFSHCE